MGIIRAIGIFILVSVGVLVLMAVAALGYLYFGDSHGLKAFLPWESAKVQEEAPPAEEPAEDGAPAPAPADRNPYLNADQEAALESMGVDVGKLPESITPETEACLRDAVGAERAKEIEAGATPTVVDLFKARKCL